MATPALACDPAFKPSLSCVNANGTWVVTLDGLPDQPKVSGNIQSVTGPATS